MSNMANINNMDYPPFNMTNIPNMTNMTNMNPPFKYDQYEEYANKCDQYEPPPILYANLLKMLKINKICNFKTGLPPGSRPVLRFLQHDLYA
jgi:hypothetical protein